MLLLQPAQLMLRKWYNRADGFHFKFTIQTQRHTGCYLGRKWLSPTARLHPCSQQLTPLRSGTPSVETFLLFSPLLLLCCHTGKVSFCLWKTRPSAGFYPLCLPKIFALTSSPASFIFPSPPVHSKQRTKVLGPWLLKVDSWTSSTGLPLEFVKNADSPTPDLQNQNLHFNKIPGGS